MTEPVFRRLPVADEPTGERAVRRVAEAVHRMNEAVLRAVEAGVSVELVRVSRHHDGSGNWGDQMIPMIREAPVPVSVSVSVSASGSDGEREVAA